MVRFELGRRLCGKSPATDIEQVTATGAAQPLLVAHQPIGNEGKAEGSDDSKDRITGSGTQPRHETREPALQDCPANAQHPDRADRYGDDDPDDDALQEKP